MKTLTAALLGITLLASSTANAAKHHKAAPAAPIVCLSYSLEIDDAADGREVAVCGNGTVLRYYAEKTATLPNGSNITWIVGTR